MKKEIHINGEIGVDYTLGTLNNSLMEFGSDVTELDVFINSGGGWFSEGFAIYDKLDSLPYKVNTIAIGTCGSIATVFAQSGKKGKRKIFKNAEYFVHNPIWSPLQSTTMEAKDLFLLAEDLENAQNKLKNFYSSITGKSIEELTPILDRQTTLTPQEAIEWGFVDEIVDKEFNSKTKYKIVAYLDKQTKKTNTMENHNELKNELTGIRGILAKITKTLFKNKKTELEDGTPLYFAEDVVAEGTILYLNEEMTELVPNKEHLLVGGVIAVTVDGVVTELKSADEPTETEALTAEIENLKAQLADRETVLAEKETLINETKTSIEILASKVKTFEGMIITGKGANPTGTQSNPNEVKAPISAMQAMHNYKMSLKK